ncbi:PAS domain S-box protein [Candidatus Poribacteria bacterium]|jgi:PAS domain S-box-containing protein|nr:PAS domain S-box protein [Candidatus Poribacteria bacterium]MBT7098749.1 PAS domain S-box protein [Candidatus Poribacteria bacterium]MBT7805133.1 PAS domain S-box protein [Candidatus Poribacteria bacterium]
MRRVMSLRSILRAAGILLLSLVAILGALVISGWHVRYLPLIQVRPAFVPMQYNTALGFLLGAVAALLVMRGRPRLGLAFGAACGTVGALTLVEYVLGVDLRIDQLLMDHYVLVETSHPGRMAPNTALCFALAGSAIAVAARSHGSQRHTMVLVLLGSAIVSLGSVALFGYVARVPTAYGWGNLTRMAAHTSVGFVALGTGLVAMVWLRLAVDGRRLPAAVTLPIAVAGLLTALGMSMALQGHEHSRISQTVRSTVADLALDTERAVATHVQGLERMARRVGAEPGPSQQEWEHDAGLYVEHTPAYRAIERVDEASGVRWVVPMAGHEPAHAIGSAGRTNLRVALDGARQTGETRVCTTVDVLRGGAGLIVVAPVAHGGRFGGFILGALRVEDLLSQVVSEERRTLYDVAAFERGATLVSPDRFALGIASMAHEAEASLPGTTWTLRLTPYPAMVADARTPLPGVVLAVGIAFASLLAAASHLAQKSWLQSIDSKAANAELVRAVRDQRETAVALAEREEDARAEGERFRVVFQHAPIGMALLDSSGALLRVNRALEDMLGYAADELLDMTFVDVTHPDDVEKDVRAFGQLVAREIPAYEMEKRYHHRSGEVVVGSLGVSAVFADDDALQYVIGMVADITERKRVEAELQELNRSLEDRVAERTQEIAGYASRLESSNRELEDFAYVASHDLQEPLRKILSFGDLLADEVGEEGADYLRRMQDAATRMRALISDLLTLSRLSTRALPFEPTDITQIAREVVEDLETAIADSGATVEVGDLGEVHADPVQMRQLLQNLIGNALKFRKDGLPPKVQVYVEEPSQAQDGGWRLFVRDDGIGFDEKYLDRIFTPFQRLHGRSGYAGSGMGLAICKKLVERHGGSITAESTPGTGATFVVTMPTRQQEERPQ